MTDESKHTPVEQERCACKRYGHLQAARDFIDEHDQRADDAGRAVVILRSFVQSAGKCTAPDLAAEVERLQTKREELRKSVAAIVGADVATWPDHGNVELAVAAHVAILQKAVEQKTSEVERLRAERDEAVNALPQAIRAERRKVEALEKDAARYRWLRDRATSSHEQRATPSGVDYPTTWRVVTGGSDTSIDAALDAALAASEPRNGSEAQE